MASFWLWYRPPGVAELVDARDLKSLGLGHPGSSPGARTTLKTKGFSAFPFLENHRPNSRIVRQFVRMPWAWSAISEGKEA